jgi:hypothetical protein
MYLKNNFIMINFSEEQIKNLKERTAFFNIKDFIDYLKFEHFIDTNMIEEIKINNENILTFYNKERSIIMREMLNKLFEKAFLENDLKCKKFMILNRKKWFIDYVNKNENNFK